MMRYFGVILLPAVCAGLLGCTSGEPPVQARAPMSVEPAQGTSEPNAVPARSDAVRGSSPAQEEMPAQAHYEQEPNAALPEAKEPNDPGPAPAEPNDPNVRSDVVRRHLLGPEDMPLRAHDEQEPNGLAPVAKEPNDAGGAALDEPNAPSFADRYAAVLKTYVREDGLVDYGDLRRRRLELKPILTQLDELDPNVYAGWSQQQKLAFWINAYNLKMLDIIARNYPIQSSWWLRLTWSPSDIRHIEGIWTDYKFIVMDEEFTLAAVEQRFFRRTFDDPRVFLALTYASQSGPSLHAEPYRGEDLDRQLDDQVRRFLSSPRGLQIDRQNRVVRLSALFKPNWRGKEFLARYGTDKKFKDRDPETRSVLSFLTNYLSPEEVEFLEVENYSLEYLNFDWRLNDIAKGY